MGDDGLLDAPTSRQRCVGSCRRTSEGAPGSGSRRRWTKDEGQAQQGNIAGDRHSTSWSAIGWKAWRVNAIRRPAFECGWARPGCARLAPHRGGIDAIATGRPVKDSSLLQDAAFGSVCHHRGRPSSSNAVLFLLFLACCSLDHAVTSLDQGSRRQTRRKPPHQGACIHCIHR